MRYRISDSTGLRETLARMQPGDTLELAPGLYREKLVIDKPGITIDGGGGAVISWGDGARHIAPDGQPFNTFRTYTLNVVAQDVTLRGLTVENTVKDPGREGQCVALSVLAGGFLAEDCCLRSTQDTLFCGPLPDELLLRYIDFLPREQHYYEGSPVQRFVNCRIEGSVDFIFGCGEASFDRCTIHSVDDGRALGYVAAPAHSMKQARGFLFRDCLFTAESGLKGCVYLARPWRDFGKAEFVNCTLGEHIHPDGFDPWSGTRRDRTARFSYTPCPGTERFVPWARRLEEHQAAALRDQ